MSENTGIQLYPNPATTQCNIRITGTSGNILYIRLFDIYGNLVYSGQQEIINGNSTGTIQLNQFAAGTYILRLLSDELDVSKRIEPAG